jgi:Fe-S-cluster-containing dehydrogenase component/formate-dependent nitrite reductase membrane component NrfD
MNFGFVIDNRRCIGCHACSTACKSENQVPLGVYRTWVKTTETGTYPDTRRHFQVTRCNHCANPPCVRICPTGAMYQRADGIVEFDNDSCIGCKACMQACPYDAIYIDPETHTAAKCHYCSHRTDIGLEPACVVVCPEHAIIAGDMDDPASEISQALASAKVTVRKPEQGTAPKLFYVGGSDVNLHPTAVERTPLTFAATDVLPLHGADADGVATAAQSGTQGEATAELRNRAGTALRAPQSQGLPTAGPIQIGGRRAEHMVQVGYNAQHEVPWHWPVPAYLVTKGIGAGIIMVLAALWLFEPASFDPLTAVAGGLLSLVAMGVTTALLVFDLERPERFLYILFRPQWRSWLTRGAVVLIGASNLTALWWLIETAAWLGWIDAGIAASLRAPLLALALPFALGAAVYTAFLFGQAEGRDLWQSPLLPPHLVIQAVMMGAASLLLIDAVLELSPTVGAVARWTFVGSLLVDLGVTLLGEFGMPHASEVAARAAHEISHGRYRLQFWLGAIGLGHLVALVLVLPGNSALAALGALAAMVGLYLYEHAYVMAPQEVPNS